MMRRRICILLAALLLISLPLAATPAHGEEITTSEEAISILKSLEGFVATPVYDNGQYSVGYGCSCGKDEYPNGITEEEADALMRERLAEMETSIRYFAARYSLSLTQNQFDALMLFTYNVGANWVNADGVFRQAVIDGATGNAFIYAITLWSNASSKLNLGLVKRRLAEANLYLNGVYSASKPSNFTYVKFDTCGGVSDVKVQGYDSDLTSAPTPIPILSGSRFMGWYTAQEGGSWVTTLDASTAEGTLYAHWQQGSGDPDTGTAVSYQISTDQVTELEIYQSPGGEVTDTMCAGVTVKITADYVDASNIKWGKLESGGWVNLGNPLTGVYTTHAEQEPITVTVTNSYINVRSGPGTSYAKVGTVYCGQQLELTETRLLGSDMWGKFSGGWVSLMYTDYDAVLSDSAQDSSTVIATGTVVNCSSLRIRSGAGTEYPVLGSLSAGTRVEITQQRTNNGMTWGKIASGWISLSYVTLDDTASTDTDTDTDTDASQETVTVTVTNSYINVRSGPGTTYAKVGTVYWGQQLELTETRLLGSDMWGKFSSGWVSLMYTNYASVASSGDSGETAATGTVGTVISNSPLNIRTAAGTFNTQIGTYASGTRITVYEQTDLNGVSWGRTDRGWVCMTYVRLDSTEADASGSTESTDSTATEPDSTDSDTTASGSTGTVISNSPLNIRTAAGTSNTQIGTYASGARITVYEQTDLNGVSWGRTDRGWVCMTYVRLDSTGSFSGTVTANGLRIRSGAGTDKTILGSYQAGDAVTILEVKYVGVTAWGRTDKGWICLDYVKY